MDVVQSMSEAFVKMPDVGAEVVNQMHESSPMYDRVFEEVHSIHKPYTIPIESNSCKNS